MDGESHGRPMWLLRQGEVLAALEVASTTAQRVRGLLGVSSYEGALFLPHTRAVHTMGMRFPIDVAFVDRDLRVVDIVCMAPWRLTRPRLRCRGVIEAEAGAFERWRLRPGDQLELDAPS